ncbi:MAG: sugar ABC transporter substrate-binding protein [Deltaproteobacteria bacterium]|nr:sugar ABC transporter substrate-binding protein [Deltaproteobacteria bacterium]
MFGLRNLKASKFFLKGMLILGILCALVVWSTMAFAKEDQRTELSEKFTKAVKGKTVAWSYCWAGILETEWTDIMRLNFARYGIKFIARDSDLKPDVQRQAIESLIVQRPDVLVVQSVNQTNTAQVIKKAMQQGIFVVQVNMPSVQVSDGFVGINVPQVGRMIAQDMIKEIGGGKTSGKVAIIEGDTAAPYSRDQAEAAIAEFKKDPTIKVVSRQPAVWDPNKGNEIISTVIQAHPDLAAVYSVWGPQSAGVGQALKHAGSKAKVWVASDGQMPDCDLLKQGFFHKALSYRGDILGEDIVAMVLHLLQNKDVVKPGQRQIAHYTALFWVNGPAEIPYYCWPPIKKSMN